MDPRARGKRTTTVRDRQHCIPSDAELGAYLSALPLIRPLPIVTPRPPLFFPMSTPPAPFAADEFVLHDDLVYLNHAAVAPWPRRTAETVLRFAAENATEGARNYPRGTEVEAALREQLRVLLNAPDSADIALLKNTSEGLSLIAYGLTWAAGDNIVISDEEFPSNRIVWESLRPNGVEVREARLTDGISPEEALLRRIDGYTRPLAYCTELIASNQHMDLTALGAACRER